MKNVVLIAGHGWKIKTLFIMSDLTSFGIDENFIQNKFGYCFYTKNEDHPIVYNLFVHPECRKSGAARKLVSMVIREIREDGYSGQIFIQAESTDKSVDLQKLISFYIRMGLTVMPYNN